MSSCYCAFWWIAWGIVAIYYQFLGSWRMFHSLLHRVCSCTTCLVRHGWLPSVWLKRSCRSLILFLLARLGGCSRIHMCCPSALVRPWAFNVKKRNRIVDFWTQLHEYTSFDSNRGVFLRWSMKQNFGFQYSESRSLSLSCSSGTFVNIVQRADYTLQVKKDI